MFRKITNLFKRKDSNYKSNINPSNFVIQLCRATAPNNNLFMDNILFRIDWNDTTKNDIIQFQIIMSNYIGIPVYFINEGTSYISMSSYDTDKLFNLPEELKSHPVIIALIEEINNYDENLEDNDDNSIFDMIETQHKNWFRPITYKTDTIDIYGYTFLTQPFIVKDDSPYHDKYLSFEYIYLCVNPNTELFFENISKISDINNMIMVKMTLSDFIYEFATLPWDIKQRLVKIMKSDIYFSYLLNILKRRYQNSSLFSDTSYIDTVENDNEEQEDDYDAISYYNRALDEVLK